MADFKFIRNPYSQQWTILSPRRAHRPDEGKHTLTQVCPFCPGREDTEEELSRIGGNPGDTNWDVRVIANKFPFAKTHEIIIHSQEHHKNIDELPLAQVEKLVRVYKNRFSEHKSEGNVCIFQNHGEASGESLPHPHSQLVVIPSTISLDILPRMLPEAGAIDIRSFQIFSPAITTWPDEVWIAPQKMGTTFDEITEDEIKDVSFCLQRTVQLLDMRHGHEFPFNYYIYPWKNWYIRVIPRQRRLGGFELATNIYVVTQDPKETMDFMKEHFENPNEEKIKREQQASYHKTA